MLPPVECLGIEPSVPRGRSFTATLGPSPLHSVADTGFEPVFPAYEAGEVAISSSPQPLLYQSADLVAKLAARNHAARTQHADHAQGFDPAREQGRLKVGRR